MSKTIVALDFSTMEEVITFLDTIDEPIYVKVGMELAYATQFQVLEEINKRGHDIFLDLKLHDIPNTVKGGMKNLAKLGVRMVNLHAAGGSEMMKAAMEGLIEGSEGKDRPLCIAVTQLTSTSKEAMNHEQGIQGEVIDSVLNYAKLAKDSGLDGVVCSVHEAKLVHEVCGEDFITVNPGIRLADGNANDQKRIATPEYAFEQGCNYIVVGRSITTSSNPAKTFNEIEAIMEGK